MKLLALFDRRDYDPAWPVFERYAVRAVILRENKIALVRSAAAGYYKFPGGGTESGESHVDALIRETLEETGLRLLPSSIAEFGEIVEKRKSTVNEGEIFLQHSYYYTAETDGTVSAQKLDAYEAEAGFILEWAAPAAAIETNLRLAERGGPSFLAREAHALALVERSLSPS